jgi:type IV secretion system protein VirB11
VTPPRALIAEAVNIIIYIAGRGRARRIQDIARVVGHDDRGYRLVAPPLSPDVAHTNSGEPS